MNQKIASKHPEAVLPSFVNENITANTINKTKIIILLSCYIKQKIPTINLYQDYNWNSIKFTIKLSSFKEDKLLYLLLLQNQQYL